MKYTFGPVDKYDAQTLFTFFQKLRGCQVKSGNRIIIPHDVIRVFPAESFLFMFKANVGNVPGELVVTQEFHVHGAWVTTATADDKLQRVHVDITYECGDEDVRCKDPDMQGDSRDEKCTGMPVDNRKHLTGPSPSPKSTQVGGDHYSKMKIQPIDFITANELGYMEGNIIKYVCRYKSKNGVEDLKKAQHYLQMLIEQETKSKE